MGSVQATIEQQCGVVTLTAPDALNAWTRDMQRQLAATVTAFDADDSVRAIVVTGHGDRAFCSGQDLNEVAQFSVADVDDWLDGFARVYDAVLSADKPVVAALNGVAAGSGYQLALVCDARVAHEGVRLGQPEVSSGIPSVTGMYLTWQSLGHARTSDLMLSGRLVDASEAYRIGLVQQLAPAGRVLEEAVQTALEFAAHPQLAFRLTKQRIRATLADGLAEAFHAAKQIDREAYASGEPQQTARRFLAAKAGAGA